jgi:hypothetical protein
MQVDPGTIVPTDAEAYLAEIQALTAELQRAMAAIATNAVSDFEDSVVRQREACERLHTLKASRRVADPQTTTAEPAWTEADQGTRISAATTALKLANLQYATLVKHFRETARMLAGVFRGYGGPAGSPFCMHRVEHSTWSCEL